MVMIRIHFSIKCTCLIPLKQVHGPDCRNQNHDYKHQRSAAWASALSSSNSHHLNAFSKLGGGHWVPGMGNRENTVKVHIHNLIGQWLDG